MTREVAWPRDVAATAGAFADGAELAWLDSAAADAPENASPFSLICRRPLAIVEQFDGAAAVFRRDGRDDEIAADGWKLWERVYRRLPRCAPTTSSIAPGWVGYVGFEMARLLEELPASQREDLGLPLMRLGLFDRGVVLDHRARRAHAIAAVDLRPAMSLPEEPLDRLICDWESACNAQQPVYDRASVAFHVERRRGDYEQMVRRALKYISAGDIYQVNLAQRFRFEGVGDALAAYASLRRVNPAPYAALLRWSGGAIGSVSPELFLRVSGRDVITRPIKGTRPRSGEEVRDGDSRRALLASGKDAAELAMIVDLHRNDLGRVCEFGSIRVCDARRMETHPTVFHTVADIVGRLRPECDSLDLLKACFPAGSISGVPKIRAMQIIDELEPAARGAYTGAVGVLGLDGSMCLNVAIRTLQFRDRSATLRVGGGIVADSDPSDEYKETLAKARGIVEGLTERKADAERFGPRSRLFVETTRA